MKYKNQLIKSEMIKDTFRDKLIELGEDEFIEWVENTAFKNDNNKAE